MKQTFFNILFNLAALTILSYIGVDICYRGLSFRLAEKTAVETVETATPERVYGKRPPVRDFEVIVSRNLFGAAETTAHDVKTAEIQAEEIEALEPTSLNITLLGTVTGPEANACAVIEDAVRKVQGLYRVGDAIQDGVIRKIVRGKVVLRVGEEDEVLSMDSPETPPAGTPARGSSAADTVTLARADIHESLQNINELLTQARVRPYLKDGKADGFILSYIQAGSFFTQLGLQRGDIVKSINGRPIHTPEDAFSFYQAVESGEPLSMEILRGGQPRTINYRFK
jgi:general secretion pathway protein C